MDRAKTVIVLLSLVAFSYLTCAENVSAQAKTRKPTTKATKKTVTPTAGPEQPPPTVVEPVNVPTKRNERPDGNGAGLANGRPAEPQKTPKSEQAYRYEFSQPAFLITSIKIEHDESGVGTIEFKKKGEGEQITDPVRVSPVALARINKALDELNFLSSTENYQYEKDFSHLGVVNFALKKDGLARSITLNWTDNKSAKTLMDEYRKIGNQSIWVFDISLSRDNQPLESPRLMDSLDSMIRRNEISDPYQLEPFLRELANDERIPLIARNHADRLVKQFEKERAKEDKKKTGN